jgi:hypothetical protein
MVGDTDSQAPQEIYLKSSDPIKPRSERVVPNVVGRDIDDICLASALYPYRDYSEVENELSELRARRNLA